MGGPENRKFPLLYVVKMSLIGGWVAQKSLKTPLRNIKMAPNLSQNLRKVGNLYRLKSMELSSSLMGISLLILTRVEVK